jgi:GTPase SAR1 family protein
MFVVGNKTDDKDGREVLFALGFGTAKEWGATFFETSAKMRTGVDEVFMGIGHAIEKHQSKGGCCVLL